MSIHENLLQNFRACYFYNITEMSKEQHINDIFKMILCAVVYIIDCLATLIVRKHNWLFNYKQNQTYFSENALNIQKYC